MSNLSAIRQWELLPNPAEEPFRIDQIWYLDILFVVIFTMYLFIYGTVPSPKTYPFSCVSFSFQPSSNQKYGRETPEEGLRIPSRSHVWLEGPQAAIMTTLEMRVQVALMNPRGT